MIGDKLLSLWANGLRLYAFQVFYLHQQLVQNFIKIFFKFVFVFFFTPILMEPKRRNQISDENGSRVDIPVKLIPVKLSNSTCLSTSGDQSILIGTFIYC